MVVEPHNRRRTSWKFGQDLFHIIACCLYPATALCIFCDHTSRGIDDKYHVDVFELGILPAFFGVARHIGAKPASHNAGSDPDGNSDVCQRRLATAPRVIYRFEHGAADDEHRNESEHIRGDNRIIRYHVRVTALIHAHAATITIKTVIKSWGLSYTT